MSRTEQFRGNAVPGLPGCHPTLNRQWLARLRDCFVLMLLLLGSPLSNADHRKNTTDGADAVIEELTTPQPSLSNRLDSLFGGGDSEFLDPDVAYVLSVETRGSNTVNVRFDIADGYYLYRDKLHFSLKDSPDARLSEVSLPIGIEKVDQYFGAMEVYYEQAVATLQLERTEAAPGEAELTVGYQGCADAGLCYPPMTKTVSVFFPDANAASIEQPSPITTEAETVGILPEQDRIARSLLSGNAGLMLLAFYGFGLLLTFTPCVFPMIPILSSIIVGQGKTLTSRRAFTLSLTYVLAMAATYTAAGIVAGLSGANFQAIFQQPWVLIVFSGVFVLLALAMFGLYDLQLPDTWMAWVTQRSSRQKGGTYVGVGVMGFLSALIVGPCVAAPLAGALIYISQTGDAVLGGSALFALSIGMGTPVLLVGTSAGKWLPRSARWMVVVKAIFGVLLLAVAIYLLERIVPGWVAMLLWAALLIVTAIFMGAMDSLPNDSGGWRRLWKGSGLVLVVYGVLLMVGAASGGGNPWRPLEQFSLAAGGGETRELDFRRIKGLDGLNAALRQASLEGRPVMLDYYADWCVSCKELERYTFSDKSVQAALEDVVLLQADVTANDAADQALLEHFGLFGPPAILFFDQDARERSQFRVVGFMNATDFLAHVVKALG